MAEKSNFSDLFYVLILVLGGALVIFGGLVTWKLVRSAAPQVERVHVDPDQLLEKGLASDKDQQDSKTLELSELLAKKSAGEQKNFWEEPEETEESNEEDLQVKEETLLEMPGEEGTENQPSVDPATTAENRTPSVEEFASLESTPIVATEFSYTLEDVSAPQVPTQKEVIPPQPVAKKTSAQINYASYEEGLLRCQKEQVFPCAWKDNRSEPLIKQYWIRNRQGPVERIAYTRNGKVINKTLVTLDGNVLSYKGPYAELYFEGGLLTKIRTFPYDNPDLRDWFLIGKDGKISACLCGQPTKDCCARSLLYREGGHRLYCDIFPRDTDFCK